MATKSISSTKAQNNFGRVLDDITQKQNRYIIERRGVPQVVILSIDDFSNLLSNDSESKKMFKVLKELEPEYQLGKVYNIQSK